jgi:hypothetical protein
MGEGVAGRVVPRDDADALPLEPCAMRQRIRDFKYQHVAGVPTAPLEVAPCGRVRGHRLHDFQKLTAHRHHRIDQAEDTHGRIAKSDGEAEHRVQLRGDRIEIVRDQRNLAKSHMALPAEA